MRALLLVAVMTSGCATVPQARCNSVRAEIESAHAACNACLDRVAVHGNGELCSGVCEAPAKSAPVAIAMCTAAHAAAQAKKR